jgi:hypothetical protein
LRVQYRSEEKEKLMIEAKLKSRLGAYALAAAIGLALAPAALAETGNPYSGTSAPPPGDATSPSGYTSATPSFSQPRVQAYGDTQNRRFVPPWDVTRNGAGEPSNWSTGTTVPGAPWGGD